MGLTQQQVFDSIVFLARCCDGAASEDGQGFNKVDVSFGRSLANQIQAKGSLSEKQLSCALRMVKFYRGQLDHILGEEPTFTINDPVLEENRRKAAAEAQVLPYYRARIEGDKVIFQCVRKDVPGEFDAAKNFFKGVLQARWSPGNEVGPGRARWATTIHDLGDRTDWTKMIPECIEVPPAIRELRAPNQPTKEYRPTAPGCRPYQLEAIERMRG